MIIAADDEIVSVLNFRSAKPGDMCTTKTHALDLKCVAIDLHELLSYSRLKHSEWVLLGDDPADNASQH